MTTISDKNNVGKDGEQSFVKFGADKQASSTNW
jgi:hypothetical protein